MATALLLLLAVVVVACEATGLTCPSNLDVTDAVACGTALAPGLPVNYTTMLNLTTTAPTGSVFPLGLTRVTYALKTNPYINCTFNVSVSLSTEIEIAENYTLCGTGQCGTTPPYDCVCLANTTDTYCCHLVEVPGDVNHTLDICGGHGSCEAPSVCLCDAGFGGSWCCPEAEESGEVCNDHGCCAFNSTCACDAGWSGTACEVEDVVVVVVVVTDPIQPVETAATNDILAAVGYSVAGMAGFIGLSYLSVLGVAGGATATAATATTAAAASAATVASGATTSSTASLLTTRGASAFY